MKLFRLHAERAGWSACEIVRATATKDKTMTQIDFVAEAETCPFCGGKLKVQKSKTRTVVTINEGMFKAREVKKKCATHGPSCAVVGSHQLATIVKPRQRYSYDLLVHVGLARYLRSKQRDEIRLELMEKRGIKLSSGTVSYLCDRFLVYFERLHMHRAPQLRAAMQDGYPLHIDATCEKGKGALFICIDGWRHWVLTSGRIPTENEVHLRPLIDQTLSLFGDPRATMRDMGDGVEKAVKPLSKRGIPDLICHYHFLGAVGKKLLETPHRLLADHIRHNKIRGDLRALLRILRRYRNPKMKEECFGKGQVRDELLALVLWLLEGDGKKDAPFPFAMPHFDFMKRCQQSMQRFEQWVKYPRSRPEYRSIQHLRGIVNRLNRDHRIAVAIQTIDHNFHVFCELRDVLRLSKSELPGGDARSYHPHLPILEINRLQQIEKQVVEYMTQLKQRVSPKQKKCKRPSCPNAIVLRYLERHHKKLFGHPALYDDDGSILAVAERTNNIAEHFFGHAKQKLRCCFHKHLGVLCMSARIGICTRPEKNDSNAI